MRNLARARGNGRGRRDGERGRDPRAQAPRRRARARARGVEHRDRRGRRGARRAARRGAGGAAETRAARRGARGGRSAGGSSAASGGGAAGRRRPGRWRRRRREALARDEARSRGPRRRDRRDVGLREVLPRAQKPRRALRDAAHGRGPAEGVRHTPTGERRRQLGAAVTRCDRRPAVTARTGGRRARDFAKGARRRRRMIARASSYSRRRVWRRPRVRGVDERRFAARRSRLRRFVTPSRQLCPMRGGGWTGGCSRTP